MPHQVIQGLHGLTATVQWLQRRLLFKLCKAKATGYCSRYRGFTKGYTGDSKRMGSTAGRHRSKSVKKGFFKILLYFRDHQKDDWKKHKSLCSPFKIISKPGRKGTVDR